MSVSRKIHFNAPPESVRRRWTDLTAGQEKPEPLHVEPLSSRVVSFGFLALLVSGEGGLPGPGQS